MVADEGKRRVVQRIESVKLGDRKSLRIDHEVAGSIARDLRPVPVVDDVRLLFVVECPPLAANPRGVGIAGFGHPAGIGIGVGGLGYTNVSDGSGVLGAHGRSGHGVIGQGGFGVTGIGHVIGVWGIAKQSGWAGYFSGPIRVEGKGWYADAEFSGPVVMNGDLAVQGNVTVRGDVLLPDRDIAECFEVENADACLSGTVMVIGESGALVPCTRRHDKRAVGVVAGAGTLRSAITLGVTGDGVAKASIALVGTAFCRVDADPAPIEAGDFITTSDLTGHGMRAGDGTISRGAIIGKALAPLDRGRGMVPILLALQ